MVLGGHSSGRQSVDQRPCCRSEDADGFDGGNEDQVGQVAREAVAPFDRPDGPIVDGPYQVQYDLQRLMQDLVGIVRTEEEIVRAIDGIGRLWERARTVRVYGNREYNNGWHTALDLPNLLTVAESIAKSAIERRESRGGHFRDDYPSKVDEFSKFNHVVRKGEDGRMQVSRRPLSEMPSALKKIIEDNQ